jgi:DNA-binding MarR family transcriptional regulator
MLASARMAAMHGLPLSALLSQVLVAFTIEFDNEAEHRMPHSTTDHGRTAGGLHAPWLVSMAMWWNCMRFVNEDGVTVRELARLARTGTNLDGMRRWGYIRIEPDTAGARSKKPRPDAVLRPTAAGRVAQEVWRPLFGTIEQRWEERFGKDAVDRLRDALRALAVQLDAALPDCMPILHYGLVTEGPDPKLCSAGAGTNALDRDMPLAALLARVLVAFALEFERALKVSLAICANVLRVVGDEGVRVRDLPRLSGVSKEAIAMAVGFLTKRSFAAVQPESAGSKVKVLVLTPKGQMAREAYRELIVAIEKDWRARFGEDAMRALREALEGVGGGSADTSRLLPGLLPYPDGWRAAVRKPETLPHYPMVLHRGAYPDGS